MSELLIKNFKKHVKLSKSQEKLILESVKFQKIKKKEFLIREGEHSKYSAFVLKGCLRSYFIDSNGFDHIMQFAIEDWWITDMMSYTSSQPGSLNIDALENSELLLLSREKQLLLFNECPILEKYFRIITENGMVSIQQRLMENLSLPALDRYKNFIKKYPAFNNRLPQLQIAAYLGITPEFLSKIRSKMK